MANHRATGRANTRRSRVTGGTHRDSALPASVMKVGVLGALATATIAAPLAAAAAGIDESDAVAEVAAPAADAVLEPAATAAVALPVADVAAAVETRTDDTADRSQERASTEEESAEDSATGIEVEAPADVVDASTGEELTASAEGYMRPVGGPITSGYGYRIHPVLGYGKGHDGVDFGAACGTPVHAAADGEVVAVEHNSASGNRVKIKHADGVITGYYHLQGFNTSVGAKVSQGDVIGYVGSTGRSTGCHLHFAKMDESVAYSNPMTLLK